MKLLFACILFLALTRLVLGQTFLDFGTGNIIGSVTGVSDSNSNVSGTALGAGVSFDLTITAKSVTTPTLALSDHPHGIGVSGGSNLEIDNRNDLDPNDDESIVFMLSNATGLPAGQSLRISAIDTRAISSVAREYTLFDGASTTSGSFTTSPFSIPVANLSSVTLTAVGPTSGTALNSRQRQSSHESQPFGSQWKPQPLCDLRHRRWQELRSPGLHRRHYLDAGGDTVRHGSFHDLSR